MSPIEASSCIWINRPLGIKPRWSTNLDGTYSPTYVQKNLNLITNGTVTDSTTNPPPPPWHITAVSGINDSSLIIGTATYSPTSSTDSIPAGSHGVLLLPATIKIYKKGTTAAPDNGLVVKNGDVIELQVSDLTSDQVPFLKNQPVWKYQQLKSDGTWTDWTAFGSTVVGAHAEYTTAISGIFRVEAVFFGDDTHALKFVRKKDEVVNGYQYGNGKTGDPDTFGVCDTQIQIALQQEAKKWVGSDAYAPWNPVSAQYGFSAFGTTGNAIIRCNIFVAHRGCAVGATVPAINGILHSYPPLANQWAGVQSTSHIPLNFTTTIAGWPLLSSSAYPQPGFIMAHPDVSDAGHCSIIDYDGGGIAAGSGSGYVNKLYPFYDGTSRYRQYGP